MIKQIFPKTSADNVFVKSGIFKNKTLAQVIELLNNNSGGGGGGPSPEEPSDGITDFSQATSDTVLYEGDTYPKGTYKQVTLDQGILYNDLKFVLYSHPFDVYTISQNVVINRVDATINNDITFGEIESFTSPTVWIPQFDNFKSSLPLSTKAIADGDKTYTFRKIQDSPLGKFGYWTDSQEYYSLPEMPVCIFKLGSNLYINIPETLIKTDIGDDVVLTLSELQEGGDTFLLSLMLGITKYKGIDLGELDNLIVEIPTNTGTISKKFTELNPVELHNYMSTLELEELELLMSLLNSLSQLDVDEEWLLSSIEVAFLIQGSYALLLIGFHSHWWVSAGIMTGDPDSGSSTVPIVTNKTDASRYERCLIYNKADNVASVGQPVVVLSLLGEMEGTLLLDYFPFSLNNDAVGCVVILHDVYAVLQPQRSSDLYWVDTDQRYPLRSEDYESIFSQVATGNISLYITRTLYISDGELWNAVGSVDLSDVYSRIGSVESSVSDVNSSVQSLQSIVDNMKSIRFKLVTYDDLYNSDYSLYQESYSIYNILYPTLFTVLCQVYATEHENYKILEQGEILFDAYTPRNSFYFSAPHGGQFLAIPYSETLQYGGGSTSTSSRIAIIGLNFNVRPETITLFVKNSNDLIEHFTQQGSKITLVNSADAPCTVYLNHSDTYENDYSSVNRTSNINGNTIVIAPHSSRLVQKAYEKTKITYDTDYQRKIVTTTIRHRPLDSDDNTIFTVGNVSFEMVPIPGGTFLMGSSEELHPVLVSDFYMCKTVVTPALYAAVTGSTINTTYLSWNLWKSFMDNLSTHTGKYFRFPTEAEWEYVGSKTHYMRTDPDFSYVNDLGIDNMLKNYTEWCYDNYQGYEREPVINPTGPDSGDYKITRGGGAMSYFNSVSTRLWRNPDETSASRGLRLASSRVELAPYTVTVTENISFTMIPVTGGIFNMGDSSDDNPSHSVEVYDFSIGLFEVTLELWESIMGSNPSSYSGAKKPVNNVTWYDCLDFIQLLNNVTGENFRLPTEAEWEFAARGGNLSNGYRFSGSNDAVLVSNFVDNYNYYNYVHEVALKTPNELGIYDMTGNIWEFCSDINSSTGKHIIKGGSFNDYDIKITDTFEEGHSSDVGIRLVCDSLSNSTVTVNGVSFDMVQVIGNGTINDFYIGQTEVTVALWDAIMHEHPSNVCKIPIYGKSYSEYITFINGLNLTTGLTFRLPTEAEWEYAASGGLYTNGYSYSGSEDDYEVGWIEFNSEKSSAQLYNVGSLVPNELGIFDMCGNVEEWCLDWKGDYELGEIVQTLKIDPCVINSSNAHVIRGGSYTSANGWNTYQREVYERASSTGYAALRLVLPKEPTITHEKNATTSDWWCTSNLSGQQIWCGPEQVWVSVNNVLVNTVSSAYTAEKASGESWLIYESVFRVPEDITSARTAANPELTIDDLVLKITKGINSFRYVIPGRVVPVHYPVIILAIRDSSLITNPFDWDSSIYGVTLLNHQSSSLFAGLHKTCSILVSGNSVTPYDGDSTFQVYASSTIDHTLALLYSASNLSAAGHLCICTKGQASIKYMGLELLECLYDNATIIDGGDTWLTGAKIYITKRRMCEDLTGLDINITTE